MTTESVTPLPTSERELLEEALSEVYKSLEHAKPSFRELASKLDEEVKPGILEKLKSQGYVSEKNGAAVVSAEGKKIAENVVRRQRLAERLLKDLLNVGDSVVDPAACQLEHVLSEEVTEAICTLLGHPGECPHGLSIPRGECCKQTTTTLTSVICPLAKMTRGQRGRIAYVKLQNNPEAQRILSLGLVPGAKIELIQQVPTFIVQVGEAQIAFDEDIARTVIVRLFK